MKTIPTTALLAVFSFSAWFSVRMVASVHFTQHCGGYLERAGHANTVELAAQELTRAVQYMEANDLRTGYTSVLWRTPDEDIGFWYTNVTASLAELRAVKPEASQLERSNILLKLRETLIVNNNEGDSLRVPSGISIYPDNGLFFLWGTLSVLGMALICGAILVDS